MHQQERNAYGGDVMGAAHFEDISQPHDGRVPSSDVPRFDIVVHTKVKSDVDFGEIRMPGDVELPWGGQARARCIVASFTSPCWTSGGGSRALGAERAPRPAAPLFSE